MKEFNVFTATRAELQARIAELEEAEQKICAANVTLDARAELAERQLAEIESRTVTVKLPKAMSIEGGAYCSAHAHYDADGDYYDRADVEKMLREAGIKVEAE